MKNKNSQPIKNSFETMIDALIEEKFNVSLESLSDNLRKPKADKGV